MPTGKLYQAKEKTVLNVLWAGSYWSMQKVMEKNFEGALDIYRMGALESAAVKSSEIFLRAKTSNVIVIYPNEIDQFKAIFNTSDVEGVATSYEFIKKHKEYFSDFKETNSKVAILYSNDIEYKMNLLGDGSHLQQGLRIGGQLYSESIDFDYVDGENLDKYDLLIIPRTDYLTNKQISSINSFISKGKKVVSIDSSDKLNLVGTETISEELIGEKAKSLVQPIVKSSGIAAVSYKQGNQHVIHLFNLDFNGESFVAKTNIKLNLPAGKAYYATLESPELVELSDEIPEIKTYALVVIK